MSIQTMIRAASKADARAMAMLIDIAGEGLPSWMWGKSCETGQGPLDIGTLRAEREAGDFSYRNAAIALRGSMPLGMLLGYPILEAPEDGPEDVPAAFAPFLELEAQSVGTWYVNALAVFPGARNQGIGRRLLAEAEQRAACDGIREMSIQVFSQNTGAVSLYERTGYALAASAPVRDFPCQPYYGGEVLLLKKLI